MSFATNVPMPKSGCTMASVTPVRVNCVVAEQLVTSTSLQTQCAAVSTTVSVAPPAFRAIHDNRNYNQV
jgi:hypothetical protein